VPAPPVCPTVGYRLAGHLPVTGDFTPSRRSAGPSAPSANFDYHLSRRSVIANTIKPAHVRHVIDQMQRRGVSARTVTQARAVLGGVMKQAMADALVDSNPVAAIKRPKLARAKKVVPTPEQVKAVVEASVGTSMEIPILLGATTGARRSEICGVRCAPSSWEAASRLEARGRTTTCV
jgi:site-specific recombinase XerD